MATTNSLEPDPVDPVVSVSTTEVGPASTPMMASAESMNPHGAAHVAANSQAAGNPQAGGDQAVGVARSVAGNPSAVGDPAASQGSIPSGTSEASSPRPESSATQEMEIWEDRYAFENFVGRFIIGFGLIIGCAILAIDSYAENHRIFRPLTILLGAVTTLFWLWLAFRIVRARFSHHYQLTSHRLFVSLGIFRRRRDMMELTHLKEVSLQQQTFLDHMFKVGTVVVTSNVQGTPTLFIAGVKDPQKVMDLIYHHARD